ncbi:hypothetical protein BDDG_11940 [Blastomyces dermatitidis ATCC 18188]|uniref:Uncharacterized protein n=1 Tax=Ajellomyces dermatitidis (strain ATCC 18188 / CBS 674.68) TaxID=653446 RepID=A0A0J9HDP9_AJEDA|nr:hypothetical protein BDDG_11940 [Blastomyces dermatitidis ATCC 18188]
MIVRCTPLVLTHSRPAGWLGLVAVSCIFRSLEISKCLNFEHFQPKTLVGLGH